MSTQIKTSLFYVYGDQRDKLIEIIPKSLNKVFTNGDGSLSKLLSRIPRTNFKPRFDICIDSIPKKHSKTFLLYFSSEEHKEFNDYLNNIVKEFNLSEHKKYVRTEFIIEALTKILNK